MRQRPDRRRDAQAGFTLLELLVAISLFGLIAVLLANGLRLGMRSWDAVEVEGARSAEIRLVQRYLRGRIAEAYPFVIERDATMPGFVAFEGRATTLTFVGAALPHRGIGGLQQVALVGDVDSLALRQRLFHPPIAVDEAPGELVRLERELLTGVRELRFAYFGARDREPSARWHSEWLEQARLPSLVRVDIALQEPGRSWPTLVVAPAITIDARCTVIAAGVRCPTG